MTKVITVAVIKGGTGKTQTVAALSQAAAKDGKTVLALDLDPQANLTVAMKADPLKPGIWKLLSGTPAENLIQHTEHGADIIAGSADLATETTKNSSGKRLASALAPIQKDYDFIFIDTPPAFGELLNNALQASTGVLIPLVTDTDSLQAMYQVSDIVHQLQRTSNASLHVLGTVITAYDGRSKINRYLHDIIKAKGAEVGAPLLTVIRAGVVVREARAMQENLFTYAPKSKPAADYVALYQILADK